MWQGNAETFHMTAVCPFPAQGRASCSGLRAPVPYVHIAQAEGAPCSRGWADHVSGEINTKRGNVRMGAVWRRMEKDLWENKTIKVGEALKGGNQGPVWVGRRDMGELGKRAGETLGQRMEETKMGHEEARAQPGVNGAAVVTGFPFRFIRR